MSRKQTWIWFLAPRTHRSQTELNELFIVSAVQQYSDLGSAMRRTLASDTATENSGPGSVLEDGPQARELPLLGGRAGPDQCLTSRIPEWLQSRECCRPPGLPLFKGKGLQPLPSSCAITVWGRGGGGSWRPGAHGLLRFKALLTKKSHTQTWENQILWKQTVWRECGVQGYYQGSTPAVGQGQEGRSWTALQALQGLRWPPSELSFPRRRKYRLCVHQPCSFFPSTEEDCISQLKKPGLKSTYIWFSIF